MPTPDEALSAEAAAAAEVVDLYARHADAWISARRNFAPDEPPHLRAFADRLESGGRVLDLGCGSGRPVAAFLIGRGFHVTGVDSSPGLIDRCRAEFPREDWILADMRGLDLGRSFDGVLAWYSAFHLTADEQAEMASVYARHLKPGGRLAFVGGPRRGVTLGEWRGRPLHHASLDPAEYRAALEAVGFVEVEEAILNPEADGGARVWTARRSVSD